MNFSSFALGARKVLIGTAIGALALWSIDAGVRLSFRLDGAEMGIRDWAQDRPMIDLALLCGAAFITGAIAVGQRHPALVPSYGAWLRATPWHPGRPLPLGEPALSFTDVALAAALGAFVQWYDRVGWAAPLCAMAFGYSLFAFAALAKAGRRQETWVMGWLVGAAVAFVPHVGGGWLLPVFAAAYLAARHGVRRSLETFPWDDPRAELKAAMAAATWPNSRLAPCAATPSNRSGRLADAALAGWWAFSFAWFLHRFTKPFAMEAVVHHVTVLACWTLTVIIVGLRWAAYRPGIRPPISLWGRMRTGRWLVPGYDRILVAPLILAAVGVVATTIVAALPGGWAPAGAGMLVAGLLSLAIVLPPSREDWQLTGQFHLVPIAHVKTARQQSSSSSPRERRERVMR